MIKLHEKHSLRVIKNPMMNSIDVYVVKTINGFTHVNKDGVYIECSSGVIVEPTFRLPYDTKIDIDNLTDQVRYDKVMIEEKDKHSADLMNVIKLLTGKE